MTGWSGLRRLQPPPRRRPGTFAVAVRWRYEIVVVCLLGLAWHRGGTTVLWSGLLVLVAVLGVPALRAGALGAILAVVVPHRVRSGLVQAGVGDRSGRLPWIVAAWPRGTTVMVLIWLRAGTTADDVAGARDVIESATGAAAVGIERFRRRDRILLLVQRPRWGWPGR